MELWIQFKLDASAQDALDQIERCGYAKQFEGQQQKIHKIGVNFSSKSGTIEHWTESAEA